MLQDILVGKKQSESQSGSQQQAGARGPTGLTRPLGGLTIRDLIGQMVNPPNTAIATPLSQAASMYQSLAPQLMAGASQGLAGRLTNPGGGAPNAMAGQSFLPGPDQAGVQSREQLGLPPRSSYSTFMPTPDQVANLGVLPAVGSSKTGGKIGRLGTRADALQEKSQQLSEAGKLVRAARVQGRADVVRAKQTKYKARHPEIK